MGSWWGGRIVGAKRKIIGIEMRSVRDGIRMYKFNIVGKNE